MVDSEFRSQVAFITGAAGAGIGRATALRLAAGGADIALTDVHERRLASVAEEVRAVDPGLRVRTYVVDAGERDDIDQAIADAKRDFGQIDILVNNAAVNVIGSIFDYDPAAWDRVVSVNLSGPWYLSRRVMPIMRDQGGGVIVNVSSYAPDIGGNGIETPYAVTKGGLNVLTRACAHEGGPHQIRVNTVAMGLVTGTRFVDSHPELVGEPGAIGPLGRLPTAEDIAEAIAFLASERSSSVTGETLNVAGGAYMRT